MLFHLQIKIFPKTPFLLANTCFIINLCGVDDFRLVLAGFFRITQAQQ